MNLEPTDTPTTAPADDGYARAIAVLEGDATDEPTAPAEEPVVEGEPDAKVEEAKAEPSVKAWKGIKRKERKLAEREAELANNTRQAREQINAEMAQLTELRRLHSLKSKAKENPEAILAELGLSYDDITAQILGTSKTNPAEDRVAALEAKLAQYEAQSAAQQTRALENNFLSEAAEHPELATFAESLPNGRAEVLQSAYSIGQELSAELGRRATNKEILTVLEERAAVFNRQAYSRLHSRYAESAPVPKAENSNGHRASKTGGVSPKQVTNRQASEGARAPAEMTEDERFAEAIRILGQAG